MESVHSGTPAEVAAEMTAEQLGEMVPKLTLGEVLSLEPLASVHVETYCSQADLQRPVRWIHVADATRSADLLKGGEILLTTGIAWSEQPAEREAMVASFARNDVAAVVLELGSRWHAIPEDVIAACTKHSLPLVVLHDEVKFVQVTENVHTLLLEKHMRQVVAIHKVTESFNALIVNGAPTLQILAHASRLLKAPVVLEDLSHQVVGYAEGHTLPSKLLAGWSRKSRQWTHRVGQYGELTQAVTVEDLVADQRWTMIDVQARGIVWGRLLYHGHSQSEAGGHHILGQAATALAMERLGSDNPYSWVDLIEKTALDRLVENKYTTVQGAGEVLQASGFRIEDRALIALLIEHTGEYIDPTVYRKQIRKTFPGADFLAVPRESDPRLVTAALSVPLDGFDAHLLAGKFVAMGEKITGNFDAKIRVVFSEATTQTLELAGHIRTLSRFATPPMPRAKVTATPLSRNPLEGLLLQLSNDVRVQEFVNTTLEALIRHDAKNDSDLVDTLTAVLAHPTSRTAAAECLHLSRTALYTRIATIERLLGVDLSNGEEVFALSLALKAYRPKGE
ncbi:PucR family transcriptional regulator [Corynebacterium sp. 153RC1]|nr:MULTISPECIES: PucR family transcriptional regulator [unclassified Corynebacterium]MCQ9354891.1 PucR family transcriptional regulator [Corynebacterium sp. 1222RC1]MCQ9361544.1 PucR family transcriptional regulator [Corynebacterium sp. 153RC1]MCQ9352707.1 PucR family transcriptional regulator [Corynebacterium sp. 209RC1]MCQ9359322.1 PucR family transcriptional regulator [Corynebacterium sp. 142RC1]MCQ9363669.1 PucR family transcriptional regulator [Corynebacterium sp. 732RC1]